MLVGLLAPGPDGRLVENRRLNNPVKWKVSEVGSRGLARVGIVATVNGSRDPQQ